MAKRSAWDILELHYAYRADFNAVNVSTALHRSGKSVRPGELSAFRSDARLHDLLAHATASIGEFKAQELANTVWALAKLEVREEALMTAVARRALEILREFNAQNLANTV